jgi:serine phosphatase RsbU (regulator of sigma subunit)
MFNQAERVCVILREPESGELKPRLARTRSGTAEEIPVSRSILSRVVGERKALVCVDSSADTRFSAATTVLQFGLRTFASIPMIAGAEVIGVLQVDSSGPTRAFTEDDVATLLAVAAQTALSLANRRMQQALLTHEIMNQDLALARRIQSHFLPQTAPAIPGYSFDWTYAPALGVGGDYFDFLSLSATEHAIVIADVSGKGISAALYMAKLGSEMRHHVFAGAKPGEILRKLNKALTRELEEGMFVTLLLMLLDTATGELKVASAGHQSPIVRRADGEVSLLRVPQNSPVGMQNYGGFEEESFRLGHRDVVVAYTDGVSEAMNEQKEIFTDARLLAAIEKAGGTAVTVKESIMADVEKHRAGAPPNDDLTLICFGPV